MGRARPKIDLDCALSDLPAPMRWREYMMRVEAVIFAASQPVSRETLSAVIGSDCNLDLIIADIRDPTSWSTSPAGSSTGRGTPTPRSFARPARSRRRGSILLRWRSWC
jgi:hypothetical protein